MNKIEPTWDLYRTFLAVLQEGSLSGAARVLGLTQPTITRHIDALETALGLALFLRSQRGLVATPGAEELRPYAEALAATAAAMRRAASSAAGATAGTVRVSASDVIGAEILPAILTRLHRDNPALMIELVLSNAVEDLSRRDADIAVRMVTPRQQALVVQRIGDIPLGLHAHRSYLERHGEPRWFADLEQHSLIGFDRETAAIREMLRRMPGIERLRFALRTDSNIAQLAAIRAGFGIGLCQVALARRDPDLVRVLSDQVDLKMGTWVAMHENLRATPRCRAVFDALVRGLRDYIAS